MLLQTFDNDGKLEIKLNPEDTTILNIIAVLEYQKFLLLNQMFKEAKHTEKKEE